MPGGVQPQRVMIGALHGRSRAPPLRTEMITFTIQPRQVIIVAGLGRTAPATHREVRADCGASALGVVPPYGGVGAGCRSAAAGDDRGLAWAEQSPAPTNGNDNVYHSNSPGACCPVLGGTHRSRPTEGSGPGGVQPRQVMIVAGLGRTESSAPTEGNDAVYHSTAAGNYCYRFGADSASDTPRGTSGLWSQCPWGKSSAPTDVLP